MEFKEALRVAMCEMFELGVEHGGDLGVSRDYKTDGSGAAYDRARDGEVSEGKRMDRECRDAMTKLCDERVELLIGRLE